MVGEGRLRGPPQALRQQDLGFPESRRRRFRGSASPACTRLCGKGQTHRDQVQEWQGDRTAEWVTPPCQVTGRKLTRVSRCQRRCWGSGWDTCLSQGWAQGWRQRPHHTARSAMCLCRERWRGTGDVRARGTALLPGTSGAWAPMDPSSRPWSWAAVCVTALFELISRRIKGV